MMRGGEYYCDVPRRSARELPSGDLPLPLVFAARFEGDEPSLSDEDFRQVQDCPSVASKDVGTESSDISRGNGGVGPSI